ncbi:ubiquitin-activating enzyme e1 c [Trichoderma arundinaceum]|uniref:Ubiquitin-activating enzyme e1 c n=1 Tax=Trichoderma arundinaceum TaxID=490622 RepID=A0A395NP90_TRIAR|nr:ubiquitin-activating enzyme e1 c [Trichoderma arundinaceum]
MSVETQRAADVAADSEAIRWKYLDQIRRNAGPFTDPAAMEEEFLAQFESFKILVMFVLPRTENPDSKLTASEVAQVA